jgi:hypothetical protein
MNDQITPRPMTTVYVFLGHKTAAPSAIFSDKQKAIEWIKSNNLSGTLTEMPLDLSAYDHAVQNGLFIPKKDHERTPNFIASFSPRLWHGHFGTDYE